MKKARILSLLAVLCLCLIASPLFSQTPSVEKLDVYTKTVHRHASPVGNSLHADSIRARLNSIPDTAAVYVTLVVTLTNPIETDSLAFTLTNSESELVYDASVPITAMEGESTFGAINRVYRIKVGPYTHVKRFTATAAAKGNGNTSPAITFTKN